MDLEVGQDQVEFILQHNQSESLKNLNISAFLKLEQVGKEKNQWFPEGTPTQPMVAGAISFVFVLS
jgi:hypothetical protein